MTSVSPPPSEPRAARLSARQYRRAVERRGHDVDEVSRRAREPRSVDALIRSLRATLGHAPHA